MRKLILPLTWLLLLIAPTANATTVRYADLDGLTQTASLIFHGTVLTVETRNEGTSRAPRITTHVTFNVARVLKGQTPGPRLSLALPGGTWQDQRLLIPGMPAFERGEEVVLFLEWTGQAYTISGLRQGKYRVYRDAEGRRQARRNLEGLCVLRRPADGGKPVHEHPTVEPPVLLDELFTRIKAARRQGGEQ